MAQEIKNEYVYPSNYVGLSKGLTKLEMATFMAMQGLCANSFSMKEAMQGILKTDEPNIFPHLAKSAVAIANATIAELNKQNT